MATQESVARSAFAIQLDLLGEVELPKKIRHRYTEMFEEAWQLYPKRTSDNKQSAFKAWRARLTEGCSPLDMLAGARRYAAYIRETGKWGTEYVKMAATFFGPNHWFEGDYDASVTQSPTESAQQLLAFYATEILI